MSTWTGYSDALWAGTLGPGCLGLLLSSASGWSCDPWQFTQLLVYEMGL